MLTFFLFHNSTGVGLGLITISYRYILNFGYFLFFGILLFGFLQEMYVLYTKQRFALDISFHPSVAVVGATSRCLPRLDGWIERRMAESLDSFKTRALNMKPRFYT